MTSNSDLLDHYKLDAAQFDGCVVHTSYVSDRALNLRKVKVEKKWANVKLIGQGTFGEVWLQKEVNSEKERAVKVLRKHQMERQAIEYKRELEALAKFDKSQVGKPFLSFLPSITRLPQRTWTRHHLRYRALTSHIGCSLTFFVFV